MCRLLVSLVVVFALFASRMTWADPLPTKPSVFKTATVCTTAGGSRLELPAGWWLVPPLNWSALDTELRRLQDAETRLAAENASLKEAARNWRPAWYYIAGALSLGYTGGLTWAWIRR